MHKYRVVPSVLQVGDNLVEIIELRHRTAISDLIRDQLRPRDINTELLRVVRRVVRRGRLRTMLPGFLRRHLFHIEKFWRRRRVRLRNRTPPVIRAIARGAVSLRERRLRAFFETIREEVRKGQIVYIPHLSVRLYGAKIDWGITSLVETVGECSCIAATGDRREFLLIGPKTMLRYICSYMDSPPAPDEICESTPTRTDFRDFKHLWRDFSPCDLGDESDPFEWLSTIGVGRSLAQVHLSRCLHGDAHRGNFLGDISEPVAIDFATPGKYLYLEPSPAQCATDMLPLMLDFSPRDWYDFRRGYLYDRPHGQVVFDLIEMNDQTGWLQALRMSDYERAASLLADALLMVNGDDIEQHVMLADKRAQCLSELGRYGEAIKGETAAISLAEGRLPGEVPRLLFNLAMINHIAGNQEAALSAVKRVIAWSNEILPTASVDSPEELPYIIERANHLLTTLTTPRE